MLGINYASDSDDELQTTAVSAQDPVAGSRQAPALAVSRSLTATATALGMGSSTKSTGASIGSGLNLPPPSNVSIAAMWKTATTSGSLSLPPKPKIASSAKKIKFELPKLKRKHGSDEDADGLSDDQTTVSPAKMPRSNVPRPAGSSSLLSLLPAPRKSAPETFPALKISPAPKASPAPKTSPAPQVDDDFKLQLPSESAKEDSDSQAAAGLSTPYFPSLPQSISSAPEVEDIRPPSPKIDDPYPGYYQLPSGTWAMHDASVYQTYVERWRREYDAHIKQLEMSARAGTGAGAGARARARAEFNGGLGGLGADEPIEVRGSDLADAARAAREEKMSLTRHAGREVDRPVPKVALNPSKTGGLARTRHQLHSLLTDAYMNREALEDRIAQGKRNRKEAGNKYGF